MTSLVFIRLLYVFFLFKPFIEKPFSIDVKVDRRVKGTCTLTYFNSKGKILKNNIHVDGTSFKLNGKVEGYFTGADLQLKVRDIKNHVFLSKEYKINLEDKNLIVSLSGDSLKNLTCLNNFTDGEVLNFKKSIESIDFSTNKNLLKEKITNWCLANQSQNSSTFLLYTYSDSFSKKELGEIFKVLSPYQQKSYYGSLLQSMLYEYELRETQKGFVIPPFYSIDLKNSQFHFPSFKEKQIAILDFWASWCVPCREDSKQLKELYKKFAGKGLEIVSVSLDEDARNWQAAVKEDSIGSWIHILSSKIRNTKGIKTNLTRQLKIPGIPTYFIVNPTGEIVLRAENIEELYQFVEVFF